MTDPALTTSLLPALKRHAPHGFNVFDVMHHGMHEKQLSNVFAWLLDPGGTHRLGELGQTVFLALVNERSGPVPPLPLARHEVRQEVNTACPGLPGDIADIVLERPGESAVVLENFERSDGHGHSYAGYLSHACRRACGGPHVVVLLCRAIDPASLADGWEQSTVITYEDLVERLLEAVGRQRDYRDANADALSFLTQMQRKFGKANPVDDAQLIGFVSAMCASDEGSAYQSRDQAAAAEEFASRLKQQALEQLGESRQMLQRVKSRLLLICSHDVARLLHNDGAADPAAELPAVSARYAGIYQWSINFDLPPGPVSFGESRLSLKFGPSAWHAIERDPNWELIGAERDYGKVFVCHAEGDGQHAKGWIRQADVSLADVLSGDDVVSRLRRSIRTAMNRDDGA